MVIGVPGSGKQETIVRVLMIAKAMRQKVVLFGVNQIAIDALLIKMLDTQDRMFKQGSVCDATG